MEVPTEEDVFGEEAIQQVRSIVGIDNELTEALADPNI